MNSDRNLLFGVLALQTDLIDSSQFADACAAWAARKNASLADILVERGWITAADKADVERLLERKLKRHGGDLQATLDAVSDAGVREAMLTIEDTELRRTMDRLSSAGGHILVDPLAKPSESHTRYTLTRLHGQGGLGRVWVARDNDLNREVALKELQEESAENPVAKSRFLKEAQITGQLEHPNIVPVYELGRRGEDQPFYTMRFLRGQTLRHAISDYHRKRKDGAADPLELRRLLGAFVGVCHALAYAHSRGVIHRDVKPSNIAMGDFGEVVLLDWGLAKIAHAKENVSETLALTDGATGGETQAGRALGTPSFMSPEQAQGQLDLIGPATDVYGLGATLFDLLTGKPPHKGETTADTLDRIIKGKTPRARTVEPSVPLSLDAICAKAMAKSPSDRYTKASDLAEDIQRWLADEPVSCLVEPVPQRFARWARRHRAWTTAAGLALVAVTVSSVVAAALVDRARRQTEQARRAEATARTEATRYFKEARTAVDTHLTGVSEVLKYYPGVQPLRERLLRAAAEDYEKFAAMDSDNSEVEAEFARASIRLGDVRLKLADLPGAERAYRFAESLLARLHQQDPTIAELVLDRAKNQTKLGNTLKARGQSADAEQAYVTAIDDLERLLVEQSDTNEYNDALATSLVNYGILLHSAGRIPEAEQAVHRAVAIFVELHGATPTEPRYQFGLASARMIAGEMLGAQARNREAADQFSQATRDFESLEKIAPNDPTYVEAASNSRVYLASALIALGREEEELQSYEAEITNYELLLKAIPDMPRYRELLGLACNNLGQLLHKLDRNPESKVQLDRAQREFQTLVKDYPSVPQYHEEFAIACNGLGQVLGDLGQNSEAEVAILLAVETFERLNERFDNPEYSQRLAVGLLTQGRFLHKARRYEKARENYDQAIKLLRELCRRDVPDPYFCDDLAWGLTRLGHLLWEMELADEARDHFREALAVRAKLAADFPEPEFFHNLAWLCANCVDKETRDTARAIDAATRATSITAESAKYLVGLGLAHFRHGNWSECVRALENAQRFRRDGDSRGWFLRAMAYWQLDEKELARSYLNWANEWKDTHAPENHELIQFRSEAESLITGDRPQN